MKSGMTNERLTRAGFFERSPSYESIQSACIGRAVYRTVRTVKIDWSHVYVRQQAKGEGASHPNAIHQLRIAVAEEAASVIAARVQAVDVQYRLCQPFTAPLVMPSTK